MTLKEINIKQRELDFQYENAKKRFKSQRKENFDEKKHKEFLEFCNLLVETIYK